MSSEKSLKMMISTSKASLTKINKFITDGNPESFTVPILESKLANLELLLPKFDEAYFKLAESATVDEAEAEDPECSEYLDFTDKYYLTQSLISEQLKILKGENLKSVDLVPRTSACNHDHDRDIGIKTPFIDIGKFDGRSENWLKFYENYRVVIHENPKGGSNLRKFHYLISLLEGEAANLIDGIEVKEDNYEFAWNKLVDFYKNDKKLTETHIGNLFNIKKLESQSAKGLRDLHNTFVKNVNSLKKLEVEDLENNALLTYLLLSKLDNVTLKTWEEHTAASRTMPSYDTLEKFIIQQYNYLDAYESKSANQKNSNVKPGKRSTTALATNSDKSKVCKICDQNWHPVYKCRTFLNKSIDDRREIVRKISSCFQCLGFNHIARDCQGRKCSKCSQAHNYLLCKEASQGQAKDGETKAGRVESENVSSKTGFLPHPPSDASPRGTSSSQNSRGAAQTRSTTNCLATPNAGLNVSTVVFPTCVLKLMDSRKRPVSGRFLLDSASELNFTTKEFSEKLSLDLKKDKINVFGIGNVNTTSPGFITANFKSSVSDYSSRANFYVMSEITHGCVVGQTISQDTLKIPHDIQLELADPEYYKVNRKIDGILGVGIFFDIFRQSEFHPKGSAKQHYLHKTALGWVVSGEISLQEVDCYMDTCNRRACFYTTANFGPEIQDQATTKNQRRMMERMECEKHFTQNMKINSDGRFVVSLPFRQSPETLGNSYEGAKKRFLNLEKRLESKPELKQKYSEFIREYQELGHMELISEDDIHKWPNYYLPHHAVFKESTTTGLRVVFDASHQSSTGLSLNDILMRTPALQNDVFDILTAFRLPKFGLTGDVAKMYRQIWVDESDTDFQRILWRDNPHEPLRHYRLKTVTYGTSSAPYLAIRCLHAMAEEIQTEEPELAEIIKRKFFMDDYLDGADSVEELRYKQTRMENLFKNRGMELRKWCSNSTELMGELQNDMDQHYCINLSEGGTIKTLGLTWDPKSDDLVIKVHDYTGKTITKRVILGDLHTFWDPIGLLAPALIRGRIYLQELWRNLAKWDDKLPLELERKWISFRGQLHDMNGLKIPRRVLIDDAVGMELHGFSDASEKAFGFCIYVRSWNAEGKIATHLLCSESHVAPLEQRTLPRLELMAAAGLAHLMDDVIQNFKLGDDVPVSFWTDSEIVLTWINGCPQQWKTFVANRVAYIRELSKPTQWHHVCSAENPADIITRGLTAAEFANKNLWWYGPSWLMDEIHDWPTWCGSYIEPIEQKKITYSLVCIAEGTVQLLNRFSSWTKLVRVVAWILRFNFNCRNGISDRKKGHLMGWELLDAKRFILRTVQAIEFPDEVNRLSHRRQLGLKSKLLPLNAFMDDRGLLRVSGRLTNSSITYDRKFPIILPYKSHVTEIILREFHEKNHHPGPQALLTMVRGEFWPLNGKSSVKSIVHNCVTCRKASPRPIIPKMAPLPAERVNPARPFEVSGVDFCGPIYIKYGMRKSVKQKAYIAVFVCFTTKALHLELVTDLSSQAFLAALRRFFARRGTSRQIHSDNGTNLVGAQKELQYFVTDENIKSECANLGVEWKFIPPGTPHFGGLWEASVKLVKNHLKRTMDKMVMTFEEAYTLLTGIEACINSRPLTPISDDPSDPTPLTPAHFLVGGPLHLPPEPDLTQQSLTRRWDRVKQYTQEFWKRWSEEYLSGLQLRNKWRFQHDELPIGTLVALKEENLKPAEWKLARVTALHPGKDGITRVATITFKDGRSTKRPLVKLCPILTIKPKDQEDDIADGHDAIHG